MGHLQWPGTALDQVGSMHEEEWRGRSLGCWAALLLLDALPGHQGARGTSLFPPLSSQVPPLGQSNMDPTGNRFLGSSF